MERKSIFEELMRCKKWIEDALDYSGGTHVFDDIVAAVLSGHMQLWPGERGCTVTEITVFPRKKVIHVFLVAGEMDQVLDFEESMAEFGRANGCSAMTCAGRMGWGKVLPNVGSGWKKTFLALERPL